MPQDVTDDCPDRLSRRRESCRPRIERAPLAARARQNANRLDVARRETRHVRLAHPASGTEQPSQRQSERHDALRSHRQPPPQWAHRSRAGISPSARRHASSNRMTLKRPQLRVAQMPQGDPRRVEQLGVRVVKVGQIGQQFGDVVAGIQGRKIAAKRCEAFDRRGLGQQVERVGRLGKEHDIGNAQKVKATLQRRLAAAVHLWPAPTPCPARA